jgi:hypothetical protein
MSNKLIAQLMSFRARLAMDKRSEVMFEGDFDTIDEAIATLRKAQPNPDFALVPIQLTKDMELVLSEDDWQWGDLLAAANAIAEEQYAKANS